MSAHQSIPSLQFLDFQLQRFLNFTYVLKKPKDNAYGRENKDGTWTGMIGEVRRGEADMGNYLQYSFKWAMIQHSFLSFSNCTLSCDTGKK